MPNGHGAGPSGCRPGGGGFGGGMGRGGPPLMGGLGMGVRSLFGGLFSPLLTGLLGGGAGYLLGSNSANQQGQQAEQTATANDFAANTDDTKLAQLQNLGELRDSGVLTDDEFAREKSRLLGQ